MSNDHRVDSIPIDVDTELTVVLQKKGRGDYVELHVDAYGLNGSRDNFVSKDDVVTMLGVAIEQTTGDNFVRVPDATSGIVIKLSPDPALPNVEIVKVLGFGRRFSDDRMLEVLTAILDKHKEKMAEGQ